MSMSSICCIQSSLLFPSFQAYYTTVLTSKISIPLPLPPSISGLQAIRQLKRDPSGKGCTMLGHDGVCRSFDGDRNVVDAIGLSTRQIEELLDRTELSRQIENRFRGVDGRNVIDHKALFDPEDNLRPRRVTEDDKARIKRRNEELRGRIEQEKRDGVDVAEKYACGKQKSDYSII